MEMVKRIGYNHLMPHVVKSIPDNETICLLDKVVGVRKVRMSSAEQYHLLETLRGS